MTELARALEAANVHKRFFAYCRIDTLLRQRDVLAAWRRVGLERLFVGIDAISQEELVEYHKGVRVAQIELGLATAKDLGMEIFAQFVVSPRYTKRDFQKLERFINHHKIRYPSFTVLTPIPGTELLANFDSIVGIENQENGSRRNWDLFDCQNAVTETFLPRARIPAGVPKPLPGFQGELYPVPGEHFDVDQTGHYMMVTWVPWAGPSRSQYIG